uniref:Uncharacterized protein n=1 Tax=Arundo donax TaxID=35708 RepID=A0A0A8ZNF0_ARUDO
MDVIFRLVDCHTLDNPHYIMVFTMHIHIQRVRDKYEINRII